MKTNRIKYLFYFLVLITQSVWASVPPPPPPLPSITSQVQGISEGANFCTGSNVTVNAQASMDSPTFYVGNPAPNSGVIVYDKGNDEGGWRYLQMASEDIETNGGFFTGIGCECSSINYASNNLGSGYETTQNLVNTGCGSTWLTEISAATLNGFSDWYIPTIEELELVFSSFQGINSTAFSSFQSGYYWTTTPANFGACGIDGGMLQKSMTTGEIISASRSSGTGRIRLMRRFSNLPKFQWSTGVTTSSIQLENSNAGNFALGLTISGFNSNFYENTLSISDPVSWPQLATVQLNYNYTVNTQIDVINEEIYEGDSFTFNNSTLNATGVYYDSTLSESGCLEVVQLNLQVIPKPIKCRIDISYCEGNLQKLSLYSEPKVDLTNPLNVLWSSGETTSSIILSPDASGVFSVVVSNSVQSCNARIAIQNQ